MRAAVSATYGPPDVVRISDIAKPTVGEDEVLVRVHVSTVTRTDCGFRAAKPFFVRAFSGLTRPKAPVLGGEFAGFVDAVGSRVTTFAAGDRVFGFSEDRFGAHAEYLAMPAGGAIAPVPEGVTFDQAAPSTEASHYALTMIDAAGVGSGDRVLVNGATGGIGSAAVQLLRGRDAVVTGVCPGEHAELVRSLGAGRIIDLRTEDFTRERETYDVVVDAVGKSSFGRCRRLLNASGIYVSSDLGPGWMNPALALVTPLVRAKRVMFPIPRKRDGQRVRRFGEQLASGAFRPLIDRRYPLDEIVEAYRYVESGRKIGSVLIDVVPPGPAPGQGPEDAR